MKILIIYATKYGCTQKAVTLLKSKLGENVSSINIMKDKVPELKEYDTVILGGSIYVGKIQKQMHKYMLKHAEELKTKRLGLFICAGEQDSVIIEKELKASFPEELFSHAVIMETFGGELHIDKISFIEKHVIRIVKGITQDYSRLSKDKIDKYAKNILSK
ncbi:MAG TPA: flavodoxin domain-containing protein [Clostridia bacterium]|nr:flavodoxin domain-containing protein [Clostridia bacterium]